MASLDIKNYSSLSVFVYCKLIKSVSIKGAYRCSEALFVLFLFARLLHLC